MIHLDTNYLIGLPVKGSAVALDLDGWLAAGESFAASAIAWTEFLNGPVTVLLNACLRRAFGRQADFLIEDYVDPTEPLRDEGAFGDHTGYYTRPELIL